MATLEVFGQQVDVEEVFVEMAAKVWERFEAWVSVQPDFEALFHDMAQVNGVLEAEMRLQMVSVEQKQAACEAARRLAQVAARSDVEYSWTLVQLFECLATAWAEQLGE
jgi:hypothetical protein